MFFVIPKKKSTGRERKENSVSGAQGKLQSENIEIVTTINKNRYQKGDPLNLNYLLKYIF